MAAAQPSPRASLLSGLRTGGVRSVSVPHTAAPTGSFHVPRVPSSSVVYAHSYFPEEEEMDHLADAFSQNVYVGEQVPYVRQQPQTASLDGSRLSQQQHDLLLQRQLHAQAQGAPAFISEQQQAQLQMQMMQMEIMRLNAVAQMQQLAQMQASEAAQAQRLQQNWREPSTAGPRTQTFTSGMSPLAQLRARQQLEQAQSNPCEDYGHSVPMTAALGGRFGGRNPQDIVSGTYTQPKPSVSSGAAITSATPGLVTSKSDSASSWRSTSRSVLSGGRGIDRSSSTSPPKEMASSDSEGASPPLKSASLLRSRPEPLQFSDHRVKVPALAIGSNDESEAGDDSSSSKSDSDHGSSSSPTTPMSGNSNISSSSAREEASKKLFQGLGIGRPSIHVTAPPENVITIPQRIVTFPPIRQPRGPPGAVDELGDKNFANRIRKQAIGGLGALLSARERRESMSGEEIA